jgi:N6-adenosine-specific RNA methylase IME4
MFVSVYDDTGEFIAWYEVLEGDTPETPAGGGYIEGRVDGEKFYILDGVVTARPSVITETDYLVDADGVTTIMIPPGTDTLPAGTLINHEGITYTFSAADNIAFRTAIMGEWGFEIVPPFPYMQVEVTVTALAV